MQRYHAAHNCSWPMIDGEFVLHSDAQAEIARLTAERDQALARAAAAFEMAAGISVTGEPEISRITQYAISTLTPADAQKALDKMLAKAREDAIKEAAAVCSSTADEFYEGSHCREAALTCRYAILALLNDGGRDE